MNLSKRHLIALLFLALTSACADQSQFNAMSVGAQADSMDESKVPPKADQTPKLPPESTAQTSPENTQAPTPPVIERPDQVDEVPKQLDVNPENPSVPTPELGNPDLPVNPATTPPTTNPPATAPVTPKPVTPKVENKPAVAHASGLRYPLSWEIRSRMAWSSRTKAWSDFVFKVLKEGVANQVMGGAEDMEKFCPKYLTLENDIRLNVWAALVAAITKYESSYDPTTSVTEKTMGIDPITHAQVRSEGLMQLSYQDVTGWSFCHFDWEADKNYSYRDPRKTILDPFKNLDCGIRILAQQIHTKRRITLENDVYWAVLKVGGKFEKIKEISAMTRKMVPPCN